MDKGADTSVKNTDITAVDPPSPADVVDATPDISAPDITPTVPDTPSVEAPDLSANIPKPSLNTSIDVAKPELPSVPETPKVPETPSVPDITPPKVPDVPQAPGVETQSESIIPLKEDDSDDDSDNDSDDEPVEEPKEYIFTLPFESYLRPVDKENCEILVKKNSEKEGDTIWLGLSFLENYYAVFDYGNKTLGLAKSNTGWRANL